MNRIRKYNNKYQVLITPDFRISPDSSILIGNWEDENMRNFYILEFDSLNDAQYESLQYPDIDWHRLHINHEHIFVRLQNTLRDIINDSGLNCEFRATLMTPDVLKNTFMDRVANGGNRFNLRYSMNDIISFTIVNPWTSNLFNLSRKIESFREHLFRDDLRLKTKKIIDGKIIYLNGYTEFGTIYEIRLVPTLIDQWASWVNTTGFRNMENANKLYDEVLKKQVVMDGLVIR